MNTSQAYNNLPLLPPKVNFDSVSILKQVNTANKVLARLDGLIRSLDNADVILQPLQVKEAVESSGIENIQTTMSEALEAELFTPEELTGPKKETRHYKKALLSGYTKLLEKGVLTTNHCIEIQQELGIPHAGIRDLPGTQIGNKDTGEIFYTPPEGKQLIETLMKNWGEYFNEEQHDPDPLIRMAILHYQFEAIHPFFDGNGRTGRILMVLYLVRHNLLSSPALFISKFIHSNRSKYYQLLRSVTYENKWDQWILFILQAVESQADATNRTILKILDLRQKFSNYILPHFKFNYSHEVLTYLFSNAFYTQRLLMKHTPVKSRKTALEHLNRLVDANVLAVHDSNRREKVYFYPDFLHLLE